MDKAREGFEEALKHKGIALRAAYKLLPMSRVKQLGLEDDFFQVFCVRFASQYHKYDPNRGRISTWAAYQAQAACRQFKRQLYSLSCPGDVHNSSAETQRRERAAYSTRQFSQSRAGCESKDDLPEALSVEIDQGELLDQQAVVDIAKKTLTPKEMRVLMSRLQGMSQAAIAKKESVTKSRIGQIEKRANEKLGSLYKIAIKVTDHA